MPLPVHIPSANDIHPVAGVEIGIAQAGVRKAGRDDLTVFRLAPGCAVAGVFTSNRFRAAPVQVCETHLAARDDIRALVINTGNANAGTGEPGLQASLATCRETARLLGLEAEQVLPFSTGVILEPLPVDRIIAALPRAVESCKPDNWLAASYSIMTTDTQPKISSRQITLEGHAVTITGITKGSGMIRPNMATMLSYLATDAGLPPALLRQLALESAEQSFNRITVDGDMSTNDSYVLIATGRSGLNIDSVQHPAYAGLRQAIFEISLELAQKMVRDGEGATKFITVKVEQAGNREEALKVAYAVAHSPLVKTAFFASDPNLGRILAAIGYAGIADLDVSKVDLWLSGVAVASKGQRHPGYEEADGQRVMKESDIEVRIALGRGSVTEIVYTTDFSHDYVTINADYRS